MKSHYVYIWEAFWLSLGCIGLNRKCTINFGELKKLKIGQNRQNRSFWGHFSIFFMQFHAKRLMNLENICIKLPFSVKKIIKNGNHFFFIFFVFEIFLNFRNMSEKRHFLTFLPFFFILGPKKMLILTEKHLYIT